MYDNEVIEYAKEQENIISKLEYRVHEHDDGRSENRQDLMRDYARVLYSSSFRRLQGKMQLLGVDANKFNRNRLTHSLEVAQIARSIAYDLNLQHTVVAETASLAHDIGNPPFGHYGEVVLNDLSAGCGGYEGNAQAFRILRTLEKKHYAYPGLNLNVRTLMAITKYFFNKQQNSKKFLYDADYDFLKGALESKGVAVTKSIDAEIMDLADEIAYAAHDLEDALSFGMISLGEIVHEFSISDKFKDAYPMMAKIAKDAQNVAMKASRSGTSEEYAIVLKKELTSKIVNTLCSDIGLVGGCLGYKQHAKLAEGLKKLLFKAILRKKDIQLYERRGEQIIRGLFEVYSDEKYNKDNILLPPELRAINDCKTRLVTDYISGMMDSYAAQEYEKYFGKGSADKFYFK
ncbi:Deoxyguanosinetriphosphate triphosphohydrolase-like protein 2 [Vibrio crassostreae]|uniref:deoxyguanosinetriphosphate triphosphohydrolase family protein n=2 Tax=Vibrio crassostreae TaxID=246167 RepID=UPI000639B5BA|nr:deoxyguanosinetriphosphate triphosphohydrolase family protein [Vibrio crassostreae]CAK1910321.1 Deoxyguanosinetriphosphate triphosphohydrolase-like protein 2 [Vibrio crassostreae]CAK1921599.1 Deoxyguanosinetriphosphate triphosphohydrolase-like protein 2 [Vibrio crassostreae]CAK1930255.1 Deoxyguanosinetriphosphate triphosphohydrolase-like protein 2 [Vibrio crassostreae]CAK1932318.1 Deoxyguanosinetriphosphate triphosphohydrolase-like protein 2 [Vibrio crassostreae]CAK1939042.1 Deoxyguanosinet